MTSMLDPEVKPSPAREIAHKGKGCLAVIVALAVLLGGGYFFYDKASTFLTTFGEIPDYTGAGRSKITITIPDGASLDDIGSLLTDKGVIKSTKAWDKAVRQEELATSIQAGQYLMKTEMPAADALTLLINPGESRVRLQFTIREGLRLSVQVNDLVKGTKIKKSEFTDALAEPKKLGLPAYAKNRPEGFLYPETYELTADDTAATVLKRMVAQYTTVTQQLDFEEKAKQLDKSPYEALIIASIIEREVSNPQYRARVSQVLYNRLAKKQKLELDSTLIYGINSTRTTTSAADRKSTSKYNTYKYEGLPPGPIAAPGEDALEAAVDPEPGKWMYFVTVNFDTGETKFANTYAEHLKNVAQFRAWCAANTGKCT